MLNVTLAILALIVSCVVVWFAVRRSKAVQRVSNRLSGPVEQMQEQILLTADSAVDRLDGKIAQMEILLSEIDRRSNLMAQQSRQNQLQQLHIEQQQQQQLAWIQTQRQQLEKDFELRRQDFAKLQTELVVSQTRLVPPSSRIQEEPLPVPIAVAPVEIKLEKPPEQELPRVKTAKVGVKAVPAANPPPQQDKRTTILDMAEQGYSVTDIAQMMGVGKGEVMLLLKLRKKATP